MRKILFLIALVVLAASSVMGEFIVETLIPNLESSPLYSVKHGRVEMALTSKILKISDLDVKVGHIPNTAKLVGGFSFDLKALEKIGANVKYIWSGIVDSSIGIWGGYDFNSEILKPTDRVDYGLTLTVISIDFNK